MAYTATALAFMLRNLRKPVVVTGSQLPINEIRTDARQNFITALMFAAGKTERGIVVPEVCLFFRDTLYRGCRSSKISSKSYDAFLSPSYPKLGYAGESIEVYPEHVRDFPAEDEAFYVSDALASGVVATRLSPGMETHALRAILDQEEVKGIVLEAYGAGNAPSDPAFLSILRDAIQRGTHVVVGSQCPDGEVELGLYETSAKLRELGVISGVDMTTEAAVIKLQHLIGLFGDDALSIRREMRRNLVGEQSVNLLTVELGAGEASDNSEFVSSPQAFHPPPHGKPIRAHMRFFGYRGEVAQEGQEMQAEVHLNTAGLFARDVTSDHLAGKLRKIERTEGTDLFLDVSSAVRNLPSEPQEVFFSLTTTGAARMRWERAKLTVAYRE